MFLTRFSRPLIFSLLAGMALVAGRGAQAEILTNAQHALLVDYDSGEVLFCKACTEPMPPSSMSKLMTVEVLFQRLKDGRLKPEDTFHVSETAWRQGQKDNESKMWVALNSDISIDDLLKGIIIQSGGDACVVVAEALGGSEAGFAGMLNARAKELGLTQSHFVNSSGLPDPGQYMSAEDLAKLAAHVIRAYPEYYKYFAMKDFTWSNIRQPNRNTLVDENIGVDGLKTGHTDAGGYGIVASAMRNDHRLIIVLNGMKSERERINEARRLLDIGYREFKAFQLAGKGDVVGDAAIWGGAKNSVGVTVKDPLRIMMPVASRRDMKVTLRYDGPVRAPVAAGQQIGTLTVSVPGKPDKVVPAVAAEAVPSNGFLDKMMMGLQVLVFGADKV
ncbi:MAG TPA: D-alanyl-D-alanine carboxypeptidase family protein [Micropepsaceae bacterium]|nr:D-alanyl-D-alanine carboxypeptidase family protein [Micropepsaceae bacterium]